MRAATDVAARRKNSGVYKGRGKMDGVKTLADDKSSVVFIVGKRCFAGGLAGINCSCAIIFAYSIGNQDGRRRICLLQTG